MNARSRILAVLTTMTLLLGLAACGRTPSQANEGEGKGPHGGKLLSKGDFSLEVKIFEEGVPPEYRLYAFDTGKPLAPSAFEATITLARLDRTDTINFSPRGDYLLGDKEIVEPHSFDVTVKAKHNGEAYDWTFSSYEGRTVIKPEELAAAGVVIEKVGSASMKNVIELPAQIALNADRTAHVVPRLAGLATEVRKNLGDRVVRGEIMAVLDSPDLATAKEAYVESVHRLELARISAEREESLWKKKISSEEDYLIRQHALEEAKLTHQATSQRLAAFGVPAEEIAGLEKAQGTLARHVLRAPLSGVVIGKHVTVGEAVEATETIFTVADLSTVWTDITVPANQLGAVRTGQQVEVHWDDEDIKVPGKVTYVEAIVGEQTRSSRARVVIDNKDGVWRPGMFVNVHLTEDESIVPMAVKAEALQTFRDWDVVFIKVGNTFEARPLELGRREGEWVEVVSGLTPGMEYASKNSFVLKADVLKSGASHDH
ncbi:MAG: efflux RND transporter periplasmic adaptor subunit [Acidobacteria bacterium]|nr:efflux RND transporter periplasmic adaptor subunit [Acidobacteriota bacterium]